MMPSDDFDAMMRRRYFYYKRGPDFAAMIWLPAAELVGRDQPLVVAGAERVDFDLSPIGSRMFGRLVCEPIFPGDSKPAAVWLVQVTNEVRAQFQMGLQFKLLPHRVHGYLPSWDVVAFGVVTEVLDPAAFDWSTQPRG